MSQLNIHVNNHSQPYTVSEMRKRLAQVLAPLNGDQIVRFDFQATMDGYEPAPYLTVDEIRKCEAALKAAPQKTGLEVVQDIAKSIEELSCLQTPGGSVTPTIVLGPLARPEND